MGMFSMCGHCGSDWCGGECVTEPLEICKAALAKIAVLPVGTLCIVARETASAALAAAAEKERLYGKKP